MRLYSLGLLVGLAACPAPKPVTPPVTQSMTVHVQANRVVSGASVGLPGAVVSLQTANDPPTWATCTTDATGHCYVIVPASVGPSQLTIQAPAGWIDVSQHADLSPNVTLTVVLSPEHFDPSGLSLETLARIQGAMWTVPGPWPYGPRPGQPTNLTALEFIYDYGADPANLTDTQKAMLATYTAQGYTHCVFGPPVGLSYHDLWPDQDFTASADSWDRWLDWLQMFWDNGLMPVVFLHKDGETLAQTQARFEPLIRGNMRAQRLIRIVVPSGFEPSEYDWSSKTWAAFAQWGHDILPNALILIHTVVDVDAPAGTDALYDDNGKGNNKAWDNVAPYIHGWLTQSAAFAYPDQHNDPNHPDKSNFDNWAGLFDKTVSGSYYDRFHNGYAGWPTGSLWGPTAPIRIYAGEYCSYYVTWRDRPYSECVAWGDRAMAAGADGFLDGGTVK